MNKANQFNPLIAIILAALLLSSCGPASTPVLQAPLPSTTTEPPSLVTDPPVPAGGYQPVSTEVCQILQEGASGALGLTFTMEAGTPFTDYASGETGQGCTLTATTSGASISDPNDALAKLVNSFIGWTEDPLYAAGGPTGAASGMRRDAGLMLISVGWEAAAEANCPSDQPISACELTPEQKLYTVKIEAAQK